MKQHSLISPNLSGYRLLVGRSRDSSHRVSHCLGKSHLKGGISFENIHNPWPQFQIFEEHQISKWCQFEATHPHLSESTNPDDPDSFTATLRPPVTQWRIPAVHVNLNDKPIRNRNMMIEIPKKAHIVIPAQKTGPAASKGYPAGTWEVLKVHKKVSRKGF